MQNEVEIMEAIDRLDRHRSSVDFIADHIEDQNASYLLQMIVSDIEKTQTILRDLR